MLRSALVFSAFVFPTVIMAQCPQPGDLDQGITVKFDTDETDTFYNGVDGIVINKGQGIYDDQIIDWIIQLYSGVFESYVHERTSGFWRPTAAFGLEYDFDINAVFPLSAGDVGGGVQTLNDDQGSEPATFSYSVHASDGITIGDCSYDTLDIYQTYLLPDGEIGITRMVYLRDLGFGFVIESSWTNGTPESRMPIGITIDG